MSNIYYTEKELLLLKPKQVLALCEYYHVPLTEDEKNHYVRCLNKLREYFANAIPTTAMPDTYIAPELNIVGNTEQKRSVRVQRIYNSTHKKE